MTESEANSWLAGFTINDLRFTNKEIIICPSFTFLSNLKSYLLNHKSEIKVGAQDISPFNDGPYTGEVSARQIKELADYAIIGHSERRTNFYENNDMINKKITMARQYELTSILCVSNLEQINNAKFMIHNSNRIVAYEPLFAIGSGEADTPKNAENVAKKIKEIVNDTPVLYGGSVNSVNVNSFTKMPSISGVLVGGASLDPHRFLEIVKNA